MANLASFHLCCELPMEQYQSRPVTRLQWLSFYIFYLSVSLSNYTPTKRMEKELCSLVTHTHTIMPQSWSQKLLVITAEPFDPGMTADCTFSY